MTETLLTLLVNLIPVVQCPLTCGALGSCLLCLNHKTALKIRVKVCNVCYLESYISALLGLKLISLSLNPITHGLWSNLFSRERENIPPLISLKTSSCNMQK